LIHLSLLALLACQSKKEPTVSAPVVASAAVAPKEATLDAGARQEKEEKACPALPKVEPFATCGTTVVKTPVPDIEDPTHSLASFYDRIAELERGGATKRLRIGMYGDSNLTSDFISGHLRRVLQARYGDGGHGWISLSRPWGSYRHEDVVQAGFWNMFKLWAPTTHVSPDKQYGFANMAAESREIGASAWAATTKDAKAKVGQKVSHFELHYLKQKYGGSFTVQVDKKDVKTIDTKAPSFELGIDELDVDEGPHEIRCVVKGDGLVRLFGTSLDRASTEPGKPGVQLDSLGAGALNYERLTWVASDTRKVGLEKRGYDLVILWLGMNVMFVPPNKEFAKQFIGDLKAALPHTPILVMGPGDTAKDGETKSDRRIIAVVKQMREVAQETGVAFWDFREAMGGEASIIGFTKRGLTGEDHIHFGPEGSRLMGDRFLCSMQAALANHITEHPRAGCP
jgi:lysophospholipase L1-like esterase